MNKEVIKLCEHFEKIEAELKESNLNIGIVLNIRFDANEDWYHYLFVYNKENMESGVYFTVEIKGFNGFLGGVPKIENLEDIVKEFKSKAVQNG